MSGRRAPFSGKNARTQVPRSTSNSQPPVSSSHSSSSRVKHVAQADIVPRPTSLSSSATAVSGLQSAPYSQPKSPKRSGATRDGGTNIQVVVRCRGPNEIEIKQKSPIIARTEGARGKIITIRDNNQINNFAISDSQDEVGRHYAFDYVYGPEATQVLIFEDIVSPLLEEVLGGFNCTIFAYGQTGTGKTYTMQGDVEPNEEGMPSDSAGIAPRVISRLFHRLEDEASDYSVKISFMELYNEELRDLLSPDLASPHSESGPGGKDSGGLKIFDENKKGVMVMGLEEHGARDEREATKILVKGSQRRQIASTKLNLHSSRSHSIFTLTVHTKETSSKGEDLVRTGKLNLVDLAGSESIGRSGAENMRAKEAGMINQSLLTLGRVINSLVDKSPHIPYRESKLTRILQDSLGGNTKTCIIATVSPVKANYEETASTLDYALRAKSIKNRPELNQKVTKNALLKEYLAEIDRLKADLVACQTKTGRYFDEENWQEMETEQRHIKKQRDDALSAQQELESQLKTLREQSKHHFSQSQKKKAELDAANLALDERTNTLVRTERELTATKSNLADEIVVRRVHARNEAKLDRVATGLRAVATQAVKDVNGLLEKLDRKSIILSSNANVVKSHGDHLAGEASLLAKELGDFISEQRDMHRNAINRAEEFKATQVKALEAYSDFIEQQLAKLSVGITSIENKETASMDVTTAFADLVHEMSQSFRAQSASWEEDMKQRATEHLGGIGEESFKHIASTEKSLRNLSAVFDNVLEDVRNHVETERKAMATLRELTDSSTATEISLLKRQNEQLLRLIETERASTEALQKDLLSQVTKAMKGFTTARDKHIRDAFGKMSNELVDCQHEVEKHKYEHGSGVDGSLTHQKELLSRIDQRGSESKRIRDSGGTSFKHLRTSIQNGLSQVQSSIAQATAAQANLVKEETGTLDQARAGAYDRLRKGQEDRMELLQEIQADSHQAYSYLRGAVAATSQTIQETVHGVVSDVSQIGASTSNYAKSSKGHLKVIQQATTTLRTQGTKEETTTGSTPKKRKWGYTDEWEVTKGRGAVLEEWRKLQAQGLDFEDEGNGDEPLTVETIPCAESEPGIPPIKTTPVPVEPETEPEVPDGPEYVDYEVPIVDDDETGGRRRGCSTLKHDYSYHYHSSLCTPSDK
ncbi:P-loop containing nucleoside triphosphate hydrolase protein [Cantharellus anzutake]|uniref:P-loop containing nucleoside triphosphate hydrolase protein n=1 Tax=Cantharellus anzutake TaxID=1750568 RepID=UPI001903D1AE|nr:P-loop containing nucleoside triphosphate hydrolase protein [Cantharellus anzutake]KAF8342652.1 P-loop containing nucleoside triphosphate hydrolase protein [Cantharellus anzutake]